jgi:Fe-S oxidoreductase
MEQEVKEKLSKDILDILDYCINCRFCLPSCPRFDITTGDICQGASGITRALYYAIKWGMTDRGTLNELRDILYSCMTCKNCEIACKNLSTATKLVDAIEKGRQLLIEEMVGPMPEQKRALESLERYSNPYGMPPSERKGWVKGLNVPSFSKKSEILFYLGCTAPHDANAQNMARALVRLLEKSQVRFGVLEDEICCGHPSLQMGETLLFEELREKNLNQFMSLEVKHIVTLSPHCFDTFLSRYPKWATQGIKIQHYTQFLDDLIDQKKLIFNSKIEQRVTYQDPCYLGRHNNVYDAPRKVLNTIPSIELVEFPKSRADSICCGGGGGRMWADFRSEVERIANIRVREALDIGARMIVTACPWCLINIADGVKSVNVEDKLKVKDLAELCVEAL